MSGEENIAVDDEEEKRKMLSIFRDESGKNDEWNKKYIHSSLFLLGAGAFGSVFQVTTRLYTQGKQKIAKDRYIYHPDFLATVASQRRLKVDQQDKLKDRLRDDRLLDIVAIKYEILEQSHLEDGATRFFLFLRREFLIMDTIWRKFPRLLVGFPMVFDYGYIGDKLQYGVNPKYKNIFTYLNIQGEEVKFFADTHNRNMEGVTKISFLSMELLGPSIDDFRNYFDPWYAENKVKPFFQVRTVFRIADQFLCRLYMLHRAGFVHHDLKPDNIAVGNGRAMNTIYLLDFGFAKQVSNAAVSEWMGSRKFISIDTYTGEKPNYAQDVESWFYIVLTLLYDALPWSEEFIAPVLGENVEEVAKWNYVISMKKTWWGDPAEATSLQTMLGTIAKMHSLEVPDIRNILEQLHKKVRDLRSSLRQMNDAQTMNAELAQINSNISKMYMSIRKVLLQIFDLPHVWKNPHIGDGELRVYMDARREKRCPMYTWDRNNFRWEWDRNHERMLGNKSGTESGNGTENQSIALAFSKMSEQLGTRRESGTPFDAESGNNMDEPIPALDWLMGSMQNTSNPQMQAQVRNILLSVCGGGGGRGGRCARVCRPDEISYVYDRQTDSLVPKNSGRGHVASGRCTLRKSFSGLAPGVFSVAQATQLLLQQQQQQQQHQHQEEERQGSYQRGSSSPPQLLASHNVQQLGPGGIINSNVLDTVWQSGLTKVLKPTGNDADDDNGRGRGGGEEEEAATGQQRVSGGRTGGRQRRNA